MHIELVVNSDIQIDFSWACSPLWLKESGFADEIETTAVGTGPESISEAGTTG
jgi:hypothetical protein